MTLRDIDSLIAWQHSKKRGLEQILAAAILSLIKMYRVKRRIGPTNPTMTPTFSQASYSPEVSIPTPIGLDTITGT